MKDGVMVVLVLLGFLVAALDPVLFFWVVLAIACVAGTREWAKRFKP